MNSFVKFLKSSKFIDILLRQKRFSIWLKGEEFPNYDSNLRLSDLTNEYGVQDLIYDHQISVETSKMVKYELMSIKEQLKLQMLGKFIPYRHLIWEGRNFYINPNWHPMGTTRMGDDDFSSICDKNLEVHCNKNIFLINPGIFPTGSNQNPTAMTMARI
jgi:choline dehydrogenase-like flavoprotein